MARQKQGGFARPHKSGCSIDVEVSPNAKRSEIVGINPWRKTLQIRIAAEAKDGAANEELITFLAERLAVGRTSIHLIKGGKSSLKTLVIPLPVERAESILGGP